MCQCVCVCTCVREVQPRRGGVTSGLRSAAWCTRRESTPSTDVAQRNARAFVSARGNNEWHAYGFVRLGASCDLQRHRVSGNRFATWQRVAQRGTTCRQHTPAHVSTTSAPRQRTSARVVQRCCTRTAWSTRHRPWAARLFTEKSIIFRVGISLDFVRLATRTTHPHGAYARGAKRNRIEPHRCGLERPTCRTLVEARLEAHDLLPHGRHLSCNAHHIRSITRCGRLKPPTRAGLAV